PRSEWERQLASIWADLLGVNQIGVDEDVFALDVDSIMMTKMISRLHESFGVSLSLKDIFEAPTIASLAARLESSGKEPSAGALSLGRQPMDGVRQTSEGPPPVTIGQERILRIEREIPGLLQFNMPLAYRLQGPLNVGALERSLSEIVRRHEALRTGFVWRSGGPVAVITPAARVKSFFAVKDLTAGTRHSRTRAVLLTKAKAIAEQEWLTPIDLKHPPLLRARLLRLGARDHILLFLLHEIFADRWSVEVLMEELSEL